MESEPEILLPIWLMQRAIAGVLYCLMPATHLLALLSNRNGESPAMINLIGALISGLLVGWAARFFYPGWVPMGLGMTILLGIGGSLLASFLAGGGRYGAQVNRAGCLASVLGAMALIFIGRHMF